MTTPPSTRWSGGGLPVQWQLLATILAVVALAAAGVALLAYRAVEKTHREQVVRRLETARDRAARAVDLHFEELAREIEFAARDERVRAALLAFTRAGRQLEDDAALQGDRIRPEMVRLRDYLLDYYAAELETRQLRLESLLVPQRSSVWLQALYVAGGAAAARRASADVYAVEHEVWDPLLRDLARRLGWEDLLLVEAEDGRVVYDVAKTPVFQTGLLDGPYAISPLGSLFRQLRSEGGAGVRFADLAPFVPVHGRATAFAAAAIVQDGAVLGVLAAQLAPQRVAELLAAVAPAAGEGEVYVVGADAVARGRTGTTAPEPLSLPGPLLRADGKGATLEYLRRGVPVVGAAAPLAAGDLGWLALAEIGEPEALRPLAALRSRLGFACLLVLAGAALLAFAAASVIGRQARQLLEAVRAAARGESGVRARLRSRNEFGALARGLNALLDREEQGRAQDAAERERREQEIREIVAVLHAAERGDASRRARIDGQLAGLANAVNAVCASLGELSDRLCGVPPRVVEAGTTIQSATEQLLRDAVRHVDEVAQAADRSEQIGRRVQHGVAQSSAATERVLQLTDAARGLDEEIRRVAAGLGRLQKSVRAASGRVKRLGDRSMEHASLVGSIAKISADLSMLSLNAAIEASRAGQPGGGVGLVADEVRKLAERAEAAHGEIARAAEALQGEINETLGAVSRQAEHVERHAEHVAEAERLLAAILDSARACAACVQDASRAVQGSAAEAVSLQAALSDCRDGGRRMRTLAEAAHGHAQTLLAIAADLPERSAAGGAEAEAEPVGNGANGNPPRRGVGMR